MSVSSLLSSFLGLSMRRAIGDTSESSMPESHIGRLESMEHGMSTEALARALLARLATGDKLISTTAASLTNAIESAVTYRANPKTTAAHDVFHTPELLEAILLSTDLTTITTSQRVSHQFKATIDGSTKLESKRFLELKPEPTMRCQIKNCKCRGKGTSKQQFKPEINPLLSDESFCAKHFGIRSFNYELREDKEHRLIVDITFGTIAEL